MHKEKLITADLICHGAPKKEYFSRYLDEAFPNCSNIIVDFKYKKPSWEKYSILVKHDNHRYIESHETNAYFNAFLGNYILLDSCYNCSFKGENRFSDITLGDFWGCSQYYNEFYSKKGTSLVIVRNNNEFLLNILNKYCNVNEVDYYLSLKNNESYFISSKKPKDYDERLGYIKTKGFLKTFEKRKPKVNIFSNLVKKFIKDILNFKNKSCLVDKKTVGIVTDYGYFNFGNRLQNYALRYLIREYGYKTLNIFFNTSANIRKAVYLKYRFFKDRKIDREYSIYKAEKRSGDKAFLFDYSNKSKHKMRKFDLILLGSDQIWNTDYNWNNIYYHLGCFGLSDKIHISSYAASIGINRIPERYKKLFAAKLSDLDFIGVREKEGQNLLLDIGVSSTLNLDPVFLLSGPDWEKTFKYCSSLEVPKNFVFKYILESNNKEIIPEPFDKKFIVDILDLNSKYFVANHFDFVRFIKESELVVTNSFHALAFSIIFRKKVLMLERPDMMSRFTSIFNILGIHDFLGKIIDFSKVDLNCLYLIKSDSQEFLKRLLSING